MDKISSTERIIITPIKASEATNVNETRTTVDGISDSAVTKKVTNQDIEKVSQMSSGREAVKFLLEKSPLGMKKPENFEELGYAHEPHNYYGTMEYYSGPGGRIEDIHGSVENMDSTFKYKNGNFEQEVTYDKNGNLKSSKFIIRDELGFISAQYDCVLGDDGKMSIIQ